MKNRITAVILAMMLVFSSAMVLAGAADFMLGDVNGDGRITAMDARTALRASARLETLTEEQIVAADVSFDGKVSALDARMILRAASRIEALPELPTDEPASDDETTTKDDETTTKADETTTKVDEPDTGVVVEEYPEAIDAFFKGEFYLDGAMGTAGDVMAVKMATNKSGTEIVMDSGSAQLSLLAMRSSSYLKVISNDGKKYYVELTKAMMDQYGVDFGDVLGELSFITIEDAGNPVLTKGTLDGKECDVYSFTKEDGSSMRFYANGDNILKIAACDTDGKESTTIFVDELSAEIPKTMLTIKGFTATSIIMLPSLVPDFMG